MSYLLCRWSGNSIGIQPVTKLLPVIHKFHFGGPCSVRSTITPEKQDITQKLRMCVFTYLTSSECSYNILCTFSSLNCNVLLTRFCNDVSVSVFMCSQNFL